VQNKLSKILFILLNIKAHHALIIIILFLISCIDNDPVLLRVNKEIITLNSFKENYSIFLKHSLRFDNLKNRYLQANSLIDEKLIIQFAYSNSKKYENKISSKLDKIKKQLLLNDYYKKIIKNKIKPEDNFLRKIFVWSKSKILTRHLYAKSNEGIQNIKHRLESGDLWEDIASEIFKDKLLKSNGGNLGLIQIGDMEPAFEIAAFSLKDGEISEPVKTSNGYSIIQVLGREYDPIMTEDRFQHELKFLQNHAIGLLSYPALDMHTKNILTDLRIEFNDDVFNQFWDQIKLNKKEFTFSEPYGILVTFGNGLNWNTQQCLNKLNSLSLRQRNNIYSKERLMLTIKGLIVRKILLEKSMQLELHKSEYFKNEFKRAKNHLLIQSVLSNNISRGKNPKKNRIEYFNFISNLKKESIIKLDTTLIKEFIMPVNE